MRWSRSKCARNDFPVDRVDLLTDATTTRFGVLSRSARPKRHAARTCSPSRSRSCPCVPRACPRRPCSPRSMNQSMRLETSQDAQDPPSWRSDGGSPITRPATHCCGTARRWPTLASKPTVAGALTRTLRIGPVPISTATPLRPTGRATCASHSALCTRQETKRSTPAGGRRLPLTVAGTEYGLARHTPAGRRLARSPVGTGLLTPVREEFPTRYVLCDCRISPADRVSVPGSTVWRDGRQPTTPVILRTVNASLAEFK